MFSAEDWVFLSKVSTVLCLGIEFNLLYSDRILHEPFVDGLGRVCHEHSPFEIGLGQYIW